MANYMSAMKPSLNVFAFQDPRIPSYFKCIKLHAPFRPKLHSMNDIALLKKIVNSCDLLHQGQVFKAVYPLSFFIKEIWLKPSFD